MIIKQFVIQEQLELGITYEIANAAACWLDKEGAKCVSTDYYRKAGVYIVDTAFTDEEQLTAFILKFGPNLLLGEQHIRMDEERMAKYADILMVSNIFGPKTSYYSTTGSKFDDSTYE